jgi:hypothetical protein
MNTTPPFRVIVLGLLFAALGAHCTGAVAADEAGPPSYTVPLFVFDDAGLLGMTYTVAPSDDVGAPIMCLTLDLKTARCFFLSFDGTMGGLAEVPVNLNIPVPT